MNHLCMPSEIRDAEVLCSNLAMIKKGDCRIRTGGRGCSFLVEQLCKEPSPENMTLVGSFTSLDENKVDLFELANTTEMHDILIRFDLCELGTQTTY